MTHTEIMAQIILATPLGAVSNPLDGKTKIDTVFFAGQVNPKFHNLLGASGLMYHILALQFDFLQGTIDALEEGTLTGTLTNVALMRDNCIKMQNEIMRCLETARDGFPNARTTKKG